MAATATAALSSLAGSIRGQAVGSRNVLSGKQVARVPVPQHRIACEAQGAPVSRRAALATVLATGAAVLAVKPEPALAAYGESANVFGAVKKNTDYIPFKSEGFAVNIPAKWNPSKERESNEVVVRYEDNFDSLSHFFVIKKSAAGKSKIEELGSPQEFLESVSYLLGSTAQKIITSSEGGFAADKVAAANLFSSEAVQEKGKTVYKYELLTRSADSTEGGRHVLISAFVNDGNLYILKSQAGDKRWFKGAEKTVRGVAASFTPV